MTKTMLRCFQNDQGEIKITTRWKIDTEWRQWLAYKIPELIVEVLRKDQLQAFNSEVPPPPRRKMWRRTSDYFGLPSRFARRRRK